MTPRRALLRSLVFRSSKGFSFTKPKIQIFFSMDPIGASPLQDSECYDCSSLGLRFRGVKWRMAFFPVCVGKTFWVAERECSTLFSPRGRNCPVKRLWFIAIGAPNVFDGDVGNIYNFFQNSYSPPLFYVSLKATFQYTFTATVHTRGLFFVCKNRANVKIGEFERKTAILILKKCD